MSTVVAPDAQGHLRTWLFNPFHFVAGNQALGIGLVGILIAGLIGSLSHTHFDGVLDVHTGRSAPLWVFATTGFLNWLSIGIVLLIAGRLISPSRFRIIDVLGTQALARLPMLLPVIVAMIPGYRRFASNLEAKITGAPSVAVGSADTFVFAVAVLVTILTIAWMVVLMYRAFAVSCNVSGGKAIGSFIAALIIAEVLSKILITAIIQTQPLPSA